MLGKQSKGSYLFTPLCLPCFSFFFFSCKSRSKCQGDNINLRQKVDSALVIVIHILVFLFRLFSCSCENVILKFSLLAQESRIKGICKMFQLICVEVSYFVLLNAISIRFNSLVSCWYYKRISWENKKKVILPKKLRNIFCKPEVRGKFCSTFSSRTASAQLH